MNRCPNCAAQNRDGAKFCTSCGFKLPVAAESALERSPFTTTSYVPTSSGIEVTTESETAVRTDVSSPEESFSTWDSAPAENVIEVPGPGSSWDAEAPRDRAVPVSDEMIETLVGDGPTESWQVASATDREDDQVVQELEPTLEAPLVADRSPGASPGIDHLLRIARDLEYGLIELAEAGHAPAPSEGSAETADLSPLGDILAGLQSDDDLEPLRAAIATARERPRDVDVMLDLVLRAEAIATVIDERDSLKSAIESALGAVSKSDVSSDGEELEEIDGDEPSQVDDERANYASN